MLAILNSIYQFNTKNMKRNHIIPVPFAFSPYGYSSNTSYRNILATSGASQNAADYCPSNLLRKHCLTHPETTYYTFPNDQPHLGHYLKSLHSLQINLAEQIEQILPQANSIAILGGDHSISVGTGLGLSKYFDMSEVGLIWIDAHADSHTPKTSPSKCLTGCPVAINTGLGPQLLTQPFAGNFIQNIVQIGLRDVDELEIDNITSLNSHLFSILDVVELGLKKIIDSTLVSLQDCKYLWLSIDIDCLDSVYFEPGETDVPCPGGLSPRELLYIVNRINNSGKLKVTELTQVNDLNLTTPITILSSRILEIALDIGQFRYGESKVSDHLNYYNCVRQV
jgi:arginase